MPNNDAFRKSKAKNAMWKPIYNDGERTFPNLEAYHTHALACAIIEQAVYDWIALDYGNLGFAPARSGGDTLMYRAEVEIFFKSKWFEYLLSFALPNVEPKTVRKQLNIAEPERRVRCENC